MYHLVLTFPKKQSFIHQKDLNPTFNSPGMTNLPDLSGLQSYRVLPASRGNFQQNHHWRREITPECHS